LRRLCCVGVERSCTLGTAETVERRYYARRST